jgi:ssDNA-binding Zn-finger/Zn-ribbon topoisomerase 1
MTILLTPADGPECPRCGCRDSRILVKPNPKLWFGRFGKARCGYCGHVFSIRELPDEDRARPEPVRVDDDYDELSEVVVPDEAQRQKEPGKRCKKCGAMMVVTSKNRQRGKRYFKCKECSATASEALPKSERDT